MREQEVGFSVVMQFKTHLKTEIHLCGDLVLLSIMEMK
jgi:hypothetical protein